QPQQHPSEKAQRDEYSDVERHLGDVPGVEAERVQNGAEGHDLHRSAALGAVGGEVVGQRQQGEAEQSYHVARRGRSGLPATTTARPVEQTPTPAGASRAAWRPEARPWPPRKTRSYTRAERKASS